MWARPTNSRSSLSSPPLGDELSLPPPSPHHGVQRGELPGIKRLGRLPLLPREPVAPPAPLEASEPADAAPCLRDRLGMLAEWPMAA